MSSLVRIFGVSAIAGGVLRVIDSFTTHSLSAATLAALYFATDLLLLIGIAGVYWSRRAWLGIAGVVGVAIFAFGIVVIRIAAFGILGAGGYQLGAAIALLGLGVLSAEILLRNKGTDSAAVLWLAALAFGIVAALGVVPPLMTICAGVAFGAGFVFAGRRVLVA